MDENKLEDLLYQRLEVLRKRLNRMFLFLYVFPLIYFLLDNSFISEVKTPLISIVKKEIILLTFPIIYSILMLLIIVLSGRITEIHKAIFEIDTKNNSYNLKIKNLLYPIILIVELSENKITKNGMGYVEKFLVSIPLILLVFVLPLAFTFYINYVNITYSGSYSLLSLWSSILGLWILVIVAFQVKSSIKKSKELH